MADALDLLKSRRSISAQFLAEPAPDAAQLAEMLTVASRVPDHGKLAPWRFIVIRGEARKQASEALAKRFRVAFPDAEPAKAEEQRSVLARAPLVVLVVSKAGPHVKIPEIEQLLSAGAAAMNLVHAAHALGFTAQWLTGWMAYDEEASAILGVEAGERLIAVVHIGTSTVPGSERPRPPLSEIVSEWKPQS
jgi:nitroreductase